MARKIDTVLIHIHQMQISIKYSRLQYGYHTLRD